MTLSWFGATGGVAGREHRRRGRGSQDAAGVALVDGVACAVVSDGCSSAPASEVGAQLSARWVLAHAARLRRAIDDDAALADAIVDGVIAHLGRVADDLSCSGDRAPIVATLLLATLQVAIVELAPDGRALIFGVGDGVLALDAQVTRLGDGDAAPAYPAYRLIDEAGVAPAALAPTIHHAGPARAITRLALATDGALELEAGAGERLRDGTTIESLGALIADPRLATNASLLGKRLFALGEAHGRLFDDTTIALLARAPATTEV